MLETGRIKVVCRNCGYEYKASKKLCCQVIICPNCNEQMKWMPETEIIIKGGEV